MTDPASHADTYAAGVRDGHSELLLWLAGRAAGEDDPAAQALLVRVRAEMAEAVRSDRAPAGPLADDDIEAESLAADEQARFDDEAAL